MKIVKDVKKIQEMILKDFRLEFKEILGVLPWHVKGDLEIYITDLVARIYNPNDKIFAEIKKWVFENHYHHTYTDEILPKGVERCAEGEEPYVNSLELEKFLNKLKKI